MKRFKNLVIGGIQNKMVNLILITVILLTAAFSAVSLYNSNILTELAGDSSQKQRASMTEITSSVMDQVVVKSMERSSCMVANSIDHMFSEVRDRVRFLSDCAGNLFAHPEEYSPKPYAGPDASQDGVWSAKVIYADGVDPADPGLTEKLGLLANLSDTMISLCPSFGASTVYIALPEGAHFSVSDTSSSWFVNGAVRSYDPRQRGWYQQAAEAGTLIFTEGEYDANTGAYCLECAMPVYGPDGSLQAVVGTDLFLNDMEAFLQQSLIEGESLLLVNQRGRAVLAPMAERFPMSEADRTGDLRESQSELLAETVRSALQGTGSGVQQGQLLDGTYYIAGSPIPTTGWVLISAYNKALAEQPVVMLQDSYTKIEEETTAAYRQSTDHSKTTGTVLLLVVAALMLAGSIVLSTRIVKPLNTITRKISELSETNLEFKMEDAYRTGDEVEELAQSFASISHKTVEYLDTVKRVTAEKERIGAELSLATQIQAAMLPHIIPAFPDRKDFDIIGAMDPAKEVGGDFYDYFLIDEDHLGMVMADVSGKGVPAALFMMASKIILQSVAMLGASPAEILTKTNEAICSNNEAQMFVTVWVGILELSTGKLTCANAGHEYPVFKRPGGPYELYKDRHGFVLGGLEGAKYKQYEIQLEPGAKLFVYTDGVPEATNGQQELFGTERMLDALNRQPDASPMDVLKNMRKAVDGFVLNAEQFDDLTMLCLEYKGPLNQQAKGNA